MPLILAERTFTLRLLLRRQCFFDGKAYFALRRNVNYLYLDCLIFFQMLVNITYIRLRNLRDVNHTRKIARQAYKSSEICESGNLAFKYFPYFDHKRILSSP